MGRFANYIDENKETGLARARTQTGRRPREDTRILSMLYRRAHIHIGLGPTRCGITKMQKADARERSRGTTRVGGEVSVGLTAEREQVIRETLAQVKGKAHMREDKREIRRQTVAVGITALSRNFITHSFRVETEREKILFSLLTRNSRGFLAESNRVILRRDSIRFDLSLSNFYAKLLRSVFESRKRLLSIASWESHMSNVSTQTQLPYRYSFLSESRMCKRVKS